MKIINTNGMALLGPGSEWLWAMLQALALAITFYAIYRQLRTQTSAATLERMHALEDRWESRRMMLAGLKAVLALHDETGAEGLNWSMMQIAQFFDDLHGLYHRGHIGLWELQDQWGPNIRVWWTLLAPRVTEQRVLDAYPSLYSGFEELSTVVHNWNMKHGRPDDLPPLSMPELIEEIIGRRRGALLLLREAASDVIPGDVQPGKGAPSEPSPASA